MLELNNKLSKDNKEKYLKIIKIKKDLKWKNNIVLKNDSLRQNTDIDEHQLFLWFSLEHFVCKSQNFLNVSSY